MNRLLLSLAICVAIACGAAAQAKSVQLLNVSYDPTRELYKAINAAFVAEWKKKTGNDIVINQSHGGSAGRRAPSSTGSAPISSRLRCPKTSTRLRVTPSSCRSTGRSACRTASTPYTSTIVFVVRKGNPKEDPRLGRSRKARRIQIIVPNPKTSGGATLGLSRGVELCVAHAGRHGSDVQGLS